MTALWAALKHVRLPGGAIILGAILLYALGRWDKAVSVRQDDYRQAAENALAAHQGWVEQQDRLKAAGAKALQRAQASAAAAKGELAQAADSLHRHLALDLTAQDSIHTLVAERNALLAKDSAWSSAYSLLMVAHQADSARAVAAELRVGSLEAIVAQGLKVNDCHIAGLDFLPRCPSRTASLVIGVGLGAAGLYAAEH